MNCIPSNVEMELKWILIAIFFSILSFMGFMFAFGYFCGVESQRPKKTLFGNEWDSMDEKQN